jgi:hypothetical protein
VRVAQEEVAARHVLRAGILSANFYPGPTTSIYNAANSLARFRVNFSDIKTL